MPAGDFGLTAALNTRHPWARDVFEKSDRLTTTVFAKYVGRNLRIEHEHEIRYVPTHIARQELWGSGIEKAFMVCRSIPLFPYRVDAPIQGRAVYASRPNFMQLRNPQLTFMTPHNQASPEAEHEP